MRGRMDKLLTVRSSDMNRATEDRERRLLGGLGERGMRVYGDADVLRRAPILHGEDDLGDELRDVGADHVAAEDLVGGRVGDELDESGGLTRRTRAAIRREGEFAGL